MKKLFLLFVLLFAFKVNFAQHLVANWVNYHVGVDSIQDVGVAVDADNCIYVSGAEVNNATQNDIVLMKLFPDGTVEWAKVIDNNGKYEQPVKMFIGKECSVYLVFSSYDNLNNTATAIIARYDSLGNNIWTYEYNAGNTSAMVTPVDFEIDASDNINVVGNVQYNNGTTNFALKLTEAGSLLWQSTWVSANNLTASIANDLTFDNNGDLLIVAYAYDLNSYLNRNLIYKINAAGNFVWEKIINTAPSSINSFPQIKKIEFRNNNIYVTGNSGNGITDTIQIYLCDASGNLLNNWSYNGIDNISANLQDWSIDNLGNILLTGYTESNATSYDILTMKYDAQGNILWQQKLDGPTSGGDFGNKITTDATGNVIVGGITSSSTGRDYTVVRYNSAGTFIDSMIFTTPGGATKDVLGDVSVRNTNEIYATGTSVINGVPNIVTVKFGLAMAITPGSSSNNPIIITPTNSLSYQNFTLNDSKTYFSINTGDALTFNNFKFNLTSYDVSFIDFFKYENGILDTIKHIGLTGSDTTAFSLLSIGVSSKYLICVTKMNGSNNIDFGFSSKVNATCTWHCNSSDAFRNGNVIANEKFDDWVGIPNCLFPVNGQSPFQVIDMHSGPWFSSLIPSSGTPLLNTVDCYRLGTNLPACQLAHNVVPRSGNFCVGFGCQSTNTREFFWQPLSCGLYGSADGRYCYEVEFWVNRVQGTDDVDIGVAIVDGLASGQTNLSVTANTTASYKVTIPHSSSGWVQVKGTFSLSADNTNPAIVIGAFDTDNLGSSNYYLVDDVRLTAVRPKFNVPTTTICPGGTFNVNIVNNNCIRQNQTVWSTNCGTISTVTSGTYVSNINANCSVTAITTLINGCNETDVFNITVPNYNITITPNYPNGFCSGLSPAYLLTVNGAPAGAIFKWGFGGVYVTGATTNPSYAPNAIGQYSCDVFVPSTGCTYGAIYNVTANSEAACCHLAATTYNKINYTAGPSNASPWNALTQTWTAAANPFITAGSPTATIRETIKIPQGVTVTISGMTLRFSPIGKIYIEAGNSSIPGGKLILDGTTLTSNIACGGEYMWIGVEVGGVTSAPQGTISQQGFLKMYNGSIIKNAWFGVTLAYVNYVGLFSNTIPTSSNYTNTAGGIIDAKNCSFINNLVDVKFNSYIYTNPYSYAVNDNISIFDNCNFTTSNLLLNTTSRFPFAHVFMGAIRNVKFNGCVFANTNTYTTNGSVVTSNWGYGIYALGSIFKVQNNSTRNSTFKNQYIGILTSGFFNSNLYPFLCTSTDFYNCKIGINASVIAGFEVSKCSFKIYNEPQSSGITGAAVGLSFTNSTGYKIEENTFSNVLASPPVSSNNTFGILASNSGATDNRIYNNSFGILREGIHYQKVNSNNSGSTGLRFKCNKFYVNTISDKSNEIPTTTDYIAKNQGFPSATDQLMPANNTFIRSGSSYNSNDIRNNNQGAPIDYVYYYLDPPRKPQNIAGPAGAVTLTQAGNTLVFDDKKSCPSSYVSNPNPNPNKLIKKDIKALEKTVSQLGSVNPSNVDQISFLNSQKQFLLDELLRDYLLFGNYPNAYDSIKKLYDEFDVYTPLDKVQPYTAMLQDSLALIKLNEAIALQGSDEFTDYIMSFFSIDKTDSTALVTNLDNFIYSSDFRASRNAIDAKGLITNSPVYPEIYGAQSGARLMQNNKTEDLTNENIIGQIKIKFSVSPNPAYDHVVITLEKLINECAIIEFIDAKGVVQQREKITGLFNTINISKLASGNYVVRIINGNNTENVKLEVIK